MRKKNTRVSFEFKIEMCKKDEKDMLEVFCNNLKRFKDMGINDFEAGLTSSFPRIKYKGKRSEPSEFNANTWN